MLYKSRISNITHTVISEDGNHALIMYNHDPHDEAQLSWALSNANKIKNITNRNLYFYNIGSDTLSKQLLNGTFIKLTDNECTILNGYPDNYKISYMFIIRYEKEKIVFNTTIKL